MLQWCCNIILEMYLEAEPHLNPSLSPNLLKTVNGEWTNRPRGCRIVSAVSAEQFSCGSAAPQQRAGAPLSWSSEGPTRYRPGRGSGRPPPKTCTCRSHAYKTYLGRIQSLCCVDFRCRSVWLIFNEPVCSLIRRRSVDSLDEPPCPEQLGHLSKHRQSMWACFCVSVWVWVCVFVCLPPLLYAQGKLAGLPVQQCWRHSWTGRFLPSVGAETPTHPRPLPSPESNTPTHAHTLMHDDIHNKTNV